MSVQQKILKALASLQLTVVLFALSMILVFFGTVAQHEEPNWVVVEKYFRSGVVMLDMNNLSYFFQKFFELPKDVNFNFKVPFPGGWVIGVTMLLNLIAAHLMRFRLTWKRMGVLVTHSGVVLLMLGELFTGVFAVESRMTLKVGEKSNFLDVHYEPWRTHVELAFIDSSGEKEDDVTVIPSDHLKKVGEKITSELLPVDVEILEYHKNSGIADEPNPTSDSIYDVRGGSAARAVPTKEYSSLSEDPPPAPMVKVRFLDKKTGADLGTHVFSLWHYPNFSNRAFTDQPRTVEYEGKTYRALFRNKRVMEPYTIELLKFDHDRYEGTNKPKNFASTVRLVDPENGVDRVEKIAMNEPLRYRGLSYFQSGVLPGDSGTILQVVENPSWLVPYIACGVISLGLAIHFIIGLNTFLSRRASKTALTGYSQGTLMERLAPWITVALAATYLAFKSVPWGVDEESIDYRAIGNLPIQDGGRVKPLDSLARSSLLGITSKQEWRDENENWRKAIEWLILVLDTSDLRYSLASDVKIFRIEHEDLLKLFGLPKRPGFYRYSLNELRKGYDRFEEEVDKANRRVALAKRKQHSQSHEDDLRDGKFIELSEKVGIFLRVIRGRAFAPVESNAMRPRLIPPAVGETEWQTLIQIDERIQFSPERRDAQAAETRKRIIREIQADGGDINNIPPEKLQLFVERETERDLMQSPSPADRSTVSEAAGLLTTIFRAAARHAQETTREGRIEQAKICNEALEKIQKFYDTVPAKKRFSADLESYLSHSAIFFYTNMLYIFVILLVCASWLVWPMPLQRSAFYLAIFAATIHGLALAARVVISERPPVTNLYGSAVFIGWGCMVVCLILESIFKNGIGTVTGAKLGALATFVAHNYLAETGDTLDVLQAVLDTNFWLAVHVMTVTMGYVATLVLGIIGLVYLVTAIFLPVMDKAMSKTLGTMMYGTCCFAMLLSFFGTTSGGIWGDQSWGRFWGWDPKENGAVLVVIWNALILHARWCGLIKERGMAVLALVGNMVTVWSWFGTNQLGIGLHAYGFNEGLAKLCRWLWIGHFFMIILAMMPMSWWGSYAGLTAAPPIRPPESGTRPTIESFTAPTGGATVDAPSIEATDARPPKENGRNGGKKKGKRR